MKYIKLFEEFLNENSSEIENLKLMISEYYKKNFEIHPNFEKTMEIEYDNQNKLYKIFVETYNDKQLSHGKTGLSESHPKGKYPGTIDDGEIIELVNKLNNYDYIVLGKQLKKNDPYYWIEHEIGHIIGYRNGNRGDIKIFEEKEFSKLYPYPNTMDEYQPFYQQMKKMKTDGLSDEEIVNRIMYDYEHSEKNENDKPLLDMFRKFFIKFLNEKVK